MLTWRGAPTPFVWLGLSRHERQLCAWFACKRAPLCIGEILTGQGVLTGQESGRKAVELTTRSINCPRYQT